MADSVKEHVCFLSTHDRVHTLDAVVANNLTVPTVVQKLASR